MLYEGADKALGDKNYIDDFKVPGMINGAFVFSQYPRAKVLKIDTSAAEQMPGVVKVITAKDIPGEHKVGLIYKDWPVFIGEGEVTNCIGDIIAMVAAEDERTARRAAKLIQVEYEVLKPVLTPEEAMEPDAPLVHPPKPNKLCSTGLTRGNFEEAWAASAHTVNHHFPDAAHRARVSRAGVLSGDSADEWRERRRDWGISRKNNKRRH